MLVQVNTILIISSDIKRLYKNKFQNYEIIYARAFASKLSADKTVSERYSN